MSSVSVCLRAQPVKADGGRDREWWARWDERRAKMQERINRRIALETGRHRVQTASYDLSEPRKAVELEPRTEAAHTLPPGPRLHHPGGKPGQRFFHVRCVTCGRKWRHDAENPMPCPKCGFRHAEWRAGILCVYEPPDATECARRLKWYESARRRLQDSLAAG